MSGSRTVTFSLKNPVPLKCARERCSTVACRGGRVTAIWPRVRVLVVAYPPGSGARSASAVRPTRRLPNGGPAGAAGSPFVDVTPLRSAHWGLLTAEPIPKYAGRMFRAGQCRVTRRRRQRESLHDHVPACLRSPRPVQRRRHNRRHENCNLAAVLGCALASLRNTTSWWRSSCSTCSVSLRCVRG
jgi:hypothetical protein